MDDLLTHEEQELLLGRVVRTLLSDADRRAFRGRLCVVTGAAGSVGAEIARQLASCGPARLTLLDQNEERLFRLEQHLRDAHPGLPLDIELCDVTRSGSVRHALGRARPEFVFHAAAYKHVTMAERAVCAAARVNILGTAALLGDLRDTGARFVLISSDKASAPRSVMGATKRFAELLTLAHTGRGFAPIVVRFGNVLASSGSFVQIMRERIRAGRSIVLTDPDARRYFMTLAEAASLVMKAAARGAGGETCWLDMGAQVRVGDLAERLLIAAARRGWPSVPVEIIGLRPGEKLVEQLATETADERWGEQGVIHVARPHPPSLARMELLVRMLRRQIGQEDGRAVLRTLCAAIPDFEPSVQAWAQVRAARRLCSEEPQHANVRTA